MGVKGLIKAFVALSVVAVGGLTAYHYYVEEKTPSSAAFQAMEQYNGTLQSVAGAVFAPVMRKLTSDV